MKQSKEKLVSFTWFGGKSKMLDWLLPLLPECHHFIDVFGGSGAVIMNRKPSKLETFNDIHWLIANFFEVLRDKDMREELLFQLEYTPMSRKEFEDAVHLIRCADADQVSKVEMARAFFITTGQAFSGNPNPSKGGWAYVVNDNYNSCVSRWRNRMRGLQGVAERFLNIQIENLPAREILERYDNERVLCYLDPPYVHSKRSSKHDYVNEMSDQEHVELLELAKTRKAKVAISGYESDIYLEKLSDWYKFDQEVKVYSSPTRKVAKEVLWTNYNPYSGQMELF